MRDESLVHVRKHGVAGAAESDERNGSAMPLSTILGLKVGTGSGSVCRRPEWDNGSTGSGGVGLKDKVVETIDRLIIDFA